MKIYTASKSLKAETWITADIFISVDSMQNSALRGSVIWGLDVGRKKLGT